MKGSTKKEKGAKCTPSTTLVTDNVRWIFGCLVHCLRNGVGAAFNKFYLREDDKEASEAYRQLLEHMERDLIVKKFRAAQWVWHGVLFSVIVALLTVALVVPDVHSLSLLQLKFHSWTALILVAASGMPFIQFATLVCSEPFVWVFRTKRYTILFARMLKESIDSTLWFALVLWVWVTWYRPKVVKDTDGAHILHVPEVEYTHVLRIVVDEIRRLLLALTIGAVLWTVMRAIFLKLLSDFHFTALCDRVRQTILDFNAIHQIEKRRRQRKHDAGDRAHKTNETPSTSADSRVVDQDISVVIDDKEGEGESDQEDRWIIPWESVSKVKKETVPIWIVKMLIDKYVDYYTKMTTKKKNGNDHEHTILQRLEETDDNDKLMHEANMMLQDIMGGRKEDDVDIDENMLKDYGLKDEEEIKQVFELLGSKNNGEPVRRATQDQFLRCAVKAVKNCKGLKHTIKSSRRVFKKLKVLMNLFVVAITIVIWLLLSSFVTNAQIAILLTPFVSASFVFGESLKRALDGLIFVFGVHPFDVGDRIIIDKVEMKVVELHILKTVCTRSDSGVETTYPNYQLSTKTVINLEVQPEEFDFIEFTVPVDAPLELICDLQIKIKKTLDDNVTFTSESMVAKKQISDRNVMMTVYFKYLVKYISFETKAQQRSKVLSKIIRLRKQLKIDMRRLNELNKKMKTATGKNEDDHDSKFSEEDEVAADILRFHINAKVKLFKIEERKKIIMSIIRDYDPRLKGCAHALLTELNKEIITMDIRIRHSKGHLTTVEKDELKRRIENKMIEKDAEQRRERHFKVFWLLEPYWDDDC